MTTGPEARTWRKSSYSGNGANCVELTIAPTAVLARDSKNTAGPVLGFGHTKWATFLTAVKSK
ncbi:uncharacterized protein DUF397 [Herbihabitans rhizosphaerae]|uniref:Uncharacterized protein DUF397 n=1 Tax=Herbihabitans rhizosphaerae TaxID=1872711 RepID=A0A4Q7KED9_9PSEU|nr:DUF397 domain-containing protein [Herbihabitans rhizosphaerae]RZS32202.1 uncharacterized protein DUF397 [Herbihabitans rhizosphaerae]